MDKLQIISHERQEMIDITNDVQSIVTAEKIQHGIAVLYVPHTTAAIIINEGADPSVQHDIITVLQHLIPHKGNYHHAEGNSDAHVKASIIGPSTTVLIENGNLVMGTWQHIFFYEGDGPRHRTVYVACLSR